MKITVDRTINPEGDLVFTMTVKEPHNAPFGPIEKNIMDVLDFCKTGVENISPEDNKLKNDVVGLIHHAKEKAFCRVIENLKFAIKNSLELKFNPICQEIYNWIYDAQEKPLKDWLHEFDPQRTTFYFDNDGRLKNQHRNMIADDKISEDDFDDEDGDDDERLEIESFKDS